MLNKIKVILISVMMLCCLKVSFCHALENFSILNRHKKLYFLSVCSLFKDEAPYLKEWIEYHKIIGVEHFRLYNNDSTDNYLEVLEPYIRTGEVTVINWSGGHGEWCNKVQGPGIIDAVSHLKGKSKWLAIIDIDEFIVPTKHLDLVSFLKEYESYAAVVVNWQNYGTSWIQEIPSDKLMTEVLTLKANEQSKWNQQVKSIVQPMYVDTSKMNWIPHLWCYLNGQFAVAPNKEKFVWGLIDISKIRINHYVHRTENYLYNTKLAKKERMESKFTADYIENWRQSCNVIEDKAIYRFLPALREIIFSN